MHTQVLKESFFKKCTERFKKHSISTAAFVNAKEASFGPWSVNDGMPTLEEHRKLDITLQAMDLFNMGIDAVFISNCYASEDSLSRLSKLDKRLITFKAKLNKELPETEKNIILNELHCNRGDISEYGIRSSGPRVKYKGHDFKLFNAPENIKKGDILIDSSLYGNYAGEMQIAVQDIKNSGKTNVVGSVLKEYHFLLDEAKPWQKFKIEEA